MPSKTPAQARLMAAAAHDEKFAKKVGVPQDVAKEFNRADAGTGIIHPKEAVERIVDGLLEAGPVQVSPKDVKVCDRCGTGPTVAVQPGGTCYSCHQPMRPASNAEIVAYKDYLSRRENPARQKAGMPPMDFGESVLHEVRNVPCECGDPGCPVHPGKSRCPSKTSNHKVWRTDMEIEDPTYMCHGCFEDAMDSGVFTTTHTSDV